MFEKIRTIYNRIMYFFFGSLAKIFRMPIHFFTDANGWCVTFLYKDRIYKVFSLLFLFHPSSNFQKFKLFHKRLKASSFVTYVPEYAISDFYISYKYIPDTKNLFEALVSAKNSEERCLILKRVLIAVGKLHTDGLVHNDLKPKNILITSENTPFFIDFENAFETMESKYFIADYFKLLPRIIYLFSFEEIQSILNSDIWSDSLKFTIAVFTKKFDVRDLLQKKSGVRFEHDFDVESEDIDIFVKNNAGLVEIIRAFSEAELDTKVFYRNRSDVKLFVYNLAYFFELDVHLEKPLAKFEFLIQKIFISPAVQISISGPDGVGKTTLIEKIKLDGFRVGSFEIPVGSTHAVRLLRMFDGSRGVTRFLLQVDRRLFSSFFGRFIAYVLFVKSGVNPVIYFDRSFYDPYLLRTRSVLIPFFFTRLCYSRLMIFVLLHLSPDIIVSRKNECTPAIINNYYHNANHYRLFDFLCDMEQEDYLQKIKLITKYYFLTSTRFTSK